MGVSSQAEHAPPVTVTQSGAPSSVAARPRLLFIDNLRIVLITLVVIQHIAVTYGAIGSWYYRDPSSDALTGTILTIWTGIGEAAGMGLFFLLAGYFTPGSYNRKGAASFTRDRLVRLGIPLILYDALIDPLVVYIAGGMHGSYWTFYGDYLLHGNVFGNGPVWFVEALLLFTLAYAAWRWRSRRRPFAAAATEPLPRYQAIYAFILALSLVTFAVRIWWPASQVSQPLHLPLGYFPQYIGLFVAGVIAFRGDWFVRFSSRTGRYWLRVAFIAIGAMVAVAALFALVGMRMTATPSDYVTWIMETMGRVLGGFTWQSLAYAAWESLLVVGASIGLIVLMRQRWNRQGRLAKEMAASAYAVYLIHPLVLVVIAYALHTVPLYPILKFALVALIGVPLCFALTSLLRKAPLARRVL